MTTNESAIRNGVNVQALLDARSALSDAPEAAQFKWRASTQWIDGTHSESTVEEFFGLGEEQTRKSTFSFSADHPEVFASEDRGATPVELVLVGLGSECYNWAVKNTGTDPFDLQKQAQGQQQQAADAQAQVDASGQGAGAKGAVGGAAAGALIGEIASDDAGKGAAYGAAVGLIAGRRRANKSKQQASQEIEQQSQTAQAATAEQVENFKKAFSVCLEAKEYMVKF